MRSHFEGPDPTHVALRIDARSVYGRDAQGYDAGRPEYPERVYEVLTSRCGLRAGSRVLECGPGTGLVTRRLLELGARIVAVEPDPALATYLERSLPDENLEVVVAPFEDVGVEEGTFDLAVAATSFHWIDQGSGLPKLGRLLRCDGWAAIWWTIFGDPHRPDPFHDAAAGILGEDTSSQVRRSRFQLDEAARRSDLARGAGLVDVGSERIAWTARMDPGQTRALYATLISVRMLPDVEQQHVLDQLEQLASERFAGTVERPFVTVLYTAQRADTPPAVRA